MTDAAERFRVTVRRAWRLSVDPTTDPAVVRRLRQELLRFADDLGLDAARAIFAAEATALWPETGCPRCHALDPHPGLLICPQPGGEDRQP